MQHPALTICDSNMVKDAWRIGWAVEEQEISSLNLIPWHGGESVALIVCAARDETPSGLVNGISGQARTIETDGVGASPNS